MKEKVLFSWSGGKDSALALFKLLQDDAFEVIALFTTLNDTFKRISMHGVREELLDDQAAAIGLPLVKMYVHEGTNSEYEKRMEELLLKYKADGVNKVVFGDIFLEDLRIYREQNLAKVGMQAYFPLWGKETSALLREFWDLNFRTIICCVNDAFFNENDVGLELDQQFISLLPDGVDPCGENGEFHTFCYDGPLFKNKIAFLIGEKTHRPLDPSLVQGKTKGFWYCDLIA